MKTPDAYKTSLLNAAQEIDRLALVIESAVRNADPTNEQAVTVALAHLTTALRMQQ